MLKTRNDAAVDDDPILMFISNGAKSSWIAEGIQSVGHFGSSASYPQYEHYPILGNVSVFMDKQFGDFSEYGVCDNYQQILDKCPEIVESHDREFMITLTEIRKSEQLPTGGWRWHKWGEYIGTHEPEYEYLYHEKGIESVLCYHVYEYKG